jgi:hypothetical protein
MPNPLFRPPRHLVKEWPEVFEDLYMNTMPIAYLETIDLEFTDGRVWQINVADQLIVSEPDIIADRMISTLHEYKEDIKKIDFKIDIEKLKEDIKNETKKIL